MSIVKRPPGRRRGEVTADDAVAAAIEIVDREGVDAVTIHRVAKACGLSPTAPHCDRQDRGAAMKRRSRWAA
jgi:AcrR family transcriptional regulator